MNKSYIIYSSQLLNLRLSIDKTISQTMCQQQYTKSDIEKKISITQSPPIDFCIEFNEKPVIDFLKYMVSHLSLSILITPMSIQLIGEPRKIIDIYGLESVLTVEETTELINSSSINNPLYYSLLKQWDLAKNTDISIPQIESNFKGKDIEIYRLNLVENIKFIDNFLTNLWKPIKQSTHDINTQIIMLINEIKRYKYPFSNLLFKNIDSYFEFDVKKNTLECSTPVLFNLQQLSLFNSSFNDKKTAKKKTAGIKDRIVSILDGPSGNDILASVVGTALGLLTAGQVMSACLGIIPVELFNMNEENGFVNTSLGSIVTLALGKERLETVLQPATTTTQIKPQPNLDSLHSARLGHSGYHINKYLKYKHKYINLKYHSI